MTAYSDTEVLEAYRSHLSANYADALERLDLHSTVVEARGVTIRDSRGRSFLDLVAGYGVFNLGHNPATVVDALRAALSSSPLWNRPFLSASHARLAERLAELSGGALSRVFVCSTGAEAIDSALKLARLSARRTEIVAATGAFHGYSLGALSVCGVPFQARPFAPLLPGVRHVEYGNVAVLAAATSERTAAVLLEPVQAEVGALVPPEGYLRAARAICDEVGALLIVDEVRTGMGRTGPLFAIESDGVIPDVLVVGKSLAAGIVPIGAIMARPACWERFGPTFAMSASSFAGNHLACVAALATLDVFNATPVLERAQAASTILREGLDALAARYPLVVQRVTGRGLLIGLHFTHAQLAAEVIRRAIADGLLVAAAFCDRKCLLLEPPLVIEHGHVAQALEALGSACAAVSAEYSTTLAARAAHETAH